jgi:hypothetical protein
MSDLINGLVVMTPSSIDYSGTSASINADGSVSFSGVTSVSLNGVFTANHDNYMIVMRTKDANQGYNFYARLRGSGADSSGSYTRQSLYSSGTGISAGRGSDTGFRLKETGPEESGFVMYVFGPYLSQETPCRTVVVDSSNTTTIYENSGTRNAANSYDGISMLSLNAISFTGLVTVFGFNQ